MDSKTVDNAAFDAHWGAVTQLTHALGREPSHAEIACALAKAFGDALALAGATANSASLVLGINGLANDAYQETLAAIATQDCGGLV